MRRIAFGAALAVGCTAACVAQAQDSAKEIQRYREMIAEGSPADVTAQPRVVESFLGRAAAARGGSS